MKRARLFVAVAMVMGCLFIAVPAFAQFAGADSGMSPSMTSGQAGASIGMSSDITKGLPCSSCCYSCQMGSSTAPGKKSDITTDRELDLRHREYDQGPNTGMVLDPRDWAMSDCRSAKSRRCSCN